MINTWVASARPPFLLLTLSVVLMAAALAHFDHARFSVGLLALVVLGALAAHASVNMLNEVHDARSGLDDMTQRTPFSGGSGALQRNPSAIDAVEAVGLGLVIALGLYFIWLTGWGLLPIGLIGVGLVLLYTPKVTRSPWLCLIAPGLGFGPLMVMGTYYVLTGHYSCIAFGLSLIPFFLVNNLLLLNQFPDLDADRKAGRRNLLIQFGEQLGVRVFIGFLLMAFVVLALLVATDCLPVWAMLGSVMLVMAIPLALNVRQHYANLSQLQPALAWNVLINLSMPLLIAIGLWLAS